MAGPVQLNISVLVNAGGSNGGSTSVVTAVVPIPSALQSLDSNTSSGAGQSANQTGFSSVDTLTRSIFRAGGFVASTGTWYSCTQIQSITWS